MSGWAAPWPIQWGGGPTPIEQAMSALESAIGRGHAADDDGIEQRWREAKAVGLGCAMVAAERAAFDSYPQSAADLEQWRRAYRLRDTLSLEHVRQEAKFRFLDDDVVSVPDITKRLQRIDTRFSLLTRSWEESLTTMIGRSFQSYHDVSDGSAIDSPPFGNLMGETEFPYMSSKFELSILYDIGVVSSELAEYVTAGTAVNDLNVSFLVVPIPAGLPIGTQLFCQVVHETAPVLPSSSWTPLHGGAMGTAFHQVFAHPVDGTEGATVAVGTVASGRVIARVYALAGDIVSQPNFTSGNGTAVSGVSAASPLSLAFVGYDSGGTLTPFTGWSEPVAEAVAGSAATGVGIGVMVRSGGGPAAGAVLGNSEDWSVIQVGLGPVNVSLGPNEVEAVRLARGYLDDALPSWYEYSIVTSVGLLAGVSALGWTAT